VTEGKWDKSQQWQEDTVKFGKQRKQGGMGRKRAEGKGRELWWKGGMGKGHGQFENPILHCKL
jgi:hypothetical protein